MPTVALPETANLAYRVDDRSAAWLILRELTGDAIYRPEGGNCLGKEYDFNFNVETDEDVVCSELAYTVFKNIDWPTKKSWGRFTISPDHIAKKALDGAFEVRLIYHDGRKVDGDLRRALSALLRTSPVQD
jgi:hypothetical protein